MLLQKSPFVQTAVNIFSLVFSAINLDLKLLILLKRQTIPLLQTIGSLMLQGTGSDDLKFLAYLARLLTHLLAVKAYNLI